MKRIIINDADWIPADDPRRHAVEQDFFNRRNHAYEYIASVRARRECKLYKLACAACTISILVIAMALLIG